MDRKLIESKSTLELSGSTKVLQPFTVFTALYNPPIQTTPYISMLSSHHEAEQKDKHYLNVVAVGCCFFSFVILYTTLKLDSDSADDFNGDNDG